MSNQYSQLEPPTAYPVNLTLPQYKLFQRLGTIDYPSMIMLFTNNQGKIKEIRVISGIKSEVLDQSN